MQNLKQIREELQWSFAEMADALNISKSTYQTYDEGRTPPLEILQAANDQVQRNREHAKRYEPGGELDRVIADVPMFVSETL